MSLKKTDVKTYLGKRGYIVRKKYLKEEEMKKIRKDLNVKPNVNNNFNDNITSFNVFLENKNKFYLPKFYGIKNFGKPEINNIPEGQDINVNFAFNLFERQKKPVEVALKKYEEFGGGILHLQCGFGKTILACYLISKLKKKTLVVVHKEFLLNQWIERINQSLPDATIGVIQGDKYDVEGKDIVIGMLQTLWNKDFPYNAFDCFGHVVIDECHRISSEKFSRSLFRINSKYMLGLSATPTRQDGLTKVLKWHINDIIFSMKVKNDNDVDVERMIIHSKDEGYKRELVDFRGRVLMSTMINNIAYFKVRTYAIIKLIVDTLNEHNERQILLLSDRKQQLKDIYDIITEHEYCTVGYYVGGMKEAQRKESESKQLILGTYSMAKEGLDIKSLNTLIMASPKSDIIQTIGRIMRQKHENLNPKIIDIVDNFSVFKNQGKKRLAVYQKRGYFVTDINLDIDDLKVLSKRSYNYKKMNEDKKKARSAKRSGGRKKGIPNLKFSKGFN